MLRSYLIDHNIQYLYIRSFHAYTSHIAYAPYGRLNVLQHQSFPGLEHVSSHTEVIGQYRRIYRRGNLGRAGAFGAVTDDSPYTPDGIGNCTANLFIASACQIGDCRTGALQPPILASEPAAALALALTYTLLSRHVSRVCPTCNFSMGADFSFSMMIFRVLELV